MIKQQKLNIIKTRGKVYTPTNIVNHILDLSNYKGSNILKKHIIDNSCGDGAFLIEIIKRYVQEALLSNYSLNELKSDLETYIHGIEIDLTEMEKCVKNISEIASGYNLQNLQWDILCANSLFINKYNGKMDFVVGNPPYVRVHNFGNKFNDIKKFLFTQNGMTDLFIVFYEIGLKMLNKSGVLSYITPSSLFNSLACRDMRNYFINNTLITKVVDFKHNQLFNATTYTTIIVLSKTNKKEKINYYEYKLNENLLELIDVLKYNDFFLNNNFYFSNKTNLKYLCKVINNQKNKNFVEVKNGFATLNDKFFIGKFDFKNYVIPIIKASTGEKKQCLFPYSNNVLVPYKDLIKDNSLKEYFESNKTILEQRSLEKKTDWYAFGRSQGINDVYKLKYSINSIVKDINSIKLIVCPAGVGVYSGLYILTDLEENKIKKIIKNEKFINYIKMLGKYKNGGYYTFSSNDLKKYLEYELRNEDKNIEQLGIFANY